MSIGELRVAGLDSAAAQTRLQTEATFIASLIRLERDLNSTVMELIDTRDQLLALYDLTQATRNYLDVEQAMARLAYEATRLVKVQGATVLVNREKGQPLSANYPQAFLQPENWQHYLQELSIAGHQFLCRRGGTDRWPANLQNLLIVPVKVRGAANAAIGLFNKIDGDFISPDIKLARAIAEYAGAQIENAILHQDKVEQARLQTEMKLAQRVQLQLLPQKPPRVMGLDLWASSRPASRVGGDFYDFILKQDYPHTFTFTVGDISGKGMPAALLMTMARTVIRTRVNAPPFPTPEEVVSWTNRELYEDFSEVSMLATAFVGQFEPFNEHLIYANAGHAPVIYRPAGGQAKLLRADGTAMGVLPASMSLNQCLPLGPGDLLVVATDGFNEARNAENEMFGHGRLLAIVDSLAGESAQTIGQQLYQAVQRFSAGELQEDDQTVVVLKRIYG